MTALSTTGNTVTFTCGTPRVKMIICAPDIVRVRLAPDGTFMQDTLWEQYNGPYLVIKYDWPADPSFAQTADNPVYAEFQTSKLIIRAYKNPFRLSFYDLGLHPICEDNHGLGWEGDTVTCNKKMDTADHFYGCGAEATSTLDRKGLNFELWSWHTQECKDWLAPMFLNPKGYGIFVDNEVKMYFDFSKSNEYSLSTAGSRPKTPYKDGELDYYFFYGPDLKHVLDLYTQVTGKAPMIPLSAFWPWIFSIWDTTTAQIYTFANAYRIHDIPAQNCNTDLHWLHGICDFQPRDGIDIATLISSLSSIHFNWCPWSIPFVSQGECTALWNEGDAHKYFHTNPDGSTHVTFTFYWIGGDGSNLDFSDTAAASWWFGLQQHLYDSGATGSKSDDSNLFLDSGGMQDSGFEIHNIHFFLQAKTQYEKCLQYTNKRPALMMRSGWASHRFPFVWSSDQYTGDDNDMRYQMKATLNIGLSGQPYLLGQRHFSLGPPPAHPDQTGTLGPIRLDDGRHTKRYERAAMGLRANGRKRLA
jgi:alpha-glucosidase